MRNLVFTIYCHRSETRTLLPDLEKVEHLKHAEVRQIGFTTHLYPIPSEIFSNTFKNFSGLAYTNVHNTPLTDSFYITNAFPGRYCIFYVTGHYCIFYVIGHIVVLFYLYVSISVCVGLCITTCICPAFYAVILVINILYNISAMTIICNTNFSSINKSEKSWKYMVTGKHKSMIKYTFHQ